MNLRNRISMGFLLIVFLMATVAGVIIYQQSKMQTAFQNSSFISELERSLLECRRHEKNYLLRNDEESIELFNAHHDTLYTLVTNLSETINVSHIISELQALKHELTKYQSEFDQSVLYFGVDNYQRQFKECTQLCVVSARECHRIINKLETITDNQFNNALSISSIVNTFSVILGIFFSVIISGFIADKMMDLLGTPEGELIKYIQPKKRNKS